MLFRSFRGAQPHHLQSAQEAGLFEAQDVRVQAPARTETVVQEVIREVEVVREVPAAGGSALVVDKPLRSGQHVYAKGRDLIVLAMVNPGAEVIADGHIHIYAPLRGKAIAGARGQADARIFAMAMEPELISIAGIYRTAVDGRFLNVNAAGAKLLGYASPEELLETNAVTFSSPDERAAFVASVREQRGVVNRESRLIRKDGTPVWVLESATYIEPHDDQPAEIESTLVDISDRKRAQEELQRAIAAARQAFGAWSLSTPQQRYARLAGLLPAGQAPISKP